MARIAGIDIPANKQIWVSLQHIYGIGTTLSQRILTETGISPDTKTSNLTEEEVNRLRELIDREYRVEGELRKGVTPMAPKRFMRNFPKKNVTKD